MKHIFGPITLTVFLVACGFAQAGQVNVQVTGFSNDAGLARILLFKGDAGYHGEIAPERIVSVPINDGRASWLMEDVPVGDFAIIVHHDTDSDGDLNQPIFGLPLEPYGYSNGAWTSFGLPTWQQVKFNVDQGLNDQSIHIRLNAFAAAGQLVLVGLPGLVIVLGVLALFRRFRAATPILTHRKDR